MGRSSMAALVGQLAPPMALALVLGLATFAGR